MMNANDKGNLFASYDLEKELEKRRVKMGRLHHCDPVEVSRRIVNPRGGGPSMGSGTNTIHLEVRFKLGDKNEYKVTRFEFYNWPQAKNHLIKQENKEK